MYCHVCKILFTVIQFEHGFDMSYLLNVVGSVIATMKYKYSFLLSLPQMQGYVNQPDSKPGLDLKKKKFIVKIQVPMGIYRPFYLVKLIIMLCFINCISVLLAHIDYGH